jgi:HAD superfamily hydrolase (TIGR01459 family)
MQPQQQSDPLPRPPILATAEPLLTNYDVLFCDVWGVVHNGATAYREGCALLQRFREAGGTVILLTNAPRHKIAVAEILAEKHVPEAAWDAIVSSGTITAAAVNERGLARVHHIGPDRDLDLFNYIAADRVAIECAEAIVATGLIRDGIETGEDYREPLRSSAEAGMPLYCANPDLVVDVGGTLLPCAGAIAAVYEDMGGPVVWAGKPHKEAYAHARKTAEALRGKPIAPERILAIGDAIRTDIAGAAAYGIDALLIGQGIHRDQLMPDGEIIPAELDALLVDVPFRPIAAMTTLR